MSREESRLQNALKTWRENLRQWALSGELEEAAIAALGPLSHPTKLKIFINALSQGQFDILPAVAILDSTLMKGASGAYANKTQTIYLNQQYLETAYNKQLTTILTEELGHHLDELLKTTDTEGDEGEIFAALLNKDDPKDIERLRLENDASEVIVGEQIVPVEQSNSGSLPTVTLAVSPESIQEDSSGNIIFTVTRTGSTSSALTVNYSLGGTATLSSDYTADILASGSGYFSSRTVTIPAGSDSASITVDPTADTTTELNETVAISLLSGTGYSVGTADPVSATILNDDGSLPRLDLTGDGTVNSADAVLMMRHLFGTFPASSLVQDLSLSDGTPIGNVDISTFDVDQDGIANALGDGLMIIRRIFDVQSSGNELINKAIGPNSPFINLENSAGKITENIDALLTGQIIAPPEVF